MTKRLYLFGITFTVLSIIWNFVITHFILTVDPFYYKTFPIIEGFIITCSFLAINTFIGLKYFLHFKYKLVIIGYLFLLAINLWSYSNMYYEFTTGIRNQTIGELIFLVQTISIIFYANLLVFSRIKERKMLWIMGLTIGTLSALYYLLYLFEIWWLFRPLCYVLTFPAIFWILQFIHELKLLKADNSEILDME